MAGLTDGLYQHLPVFAQQAAVAAWGWGWKRRRFGPVFRAATERLRERDAWSAAEIDAEASLGLAALLDAARAAPHYRAALDEVWRPGEDPRAALARLPFLTKQDLRAHGRELLTQHPTPRGTTIFRSSGTTGTPTEIFYTAELHQTIQAFFEVRNRNWAGVTWQSRRAMFGVRKVCRHDQTRPPFWRTSPAEDLAYFSIYHLAPRFLPAYIDFLNRFRPALVTGYPSALGVVARFALDAGLRLAPARAIITTSETVTDDTRAALEAAWGCKVYDNYCAVEACMLAAQCAAGSYHVSPEFGMIEILDAEGRPCPPGQTGEVVCTGLLNRLQPLIRYRIGDVAAWSDAGPCPCGRPLPALRGIDGRVEDLCVTPDGRRVLRFDTVFKGVSAIREGQVVQERLDRFVVRVVPLPAFSPADRERLLENLRLHVGPVEAEVQAVESIPRGAGGKFRAVISLVAPPPRTAGRSAP